MLPKKVHFIGIAGAGMSAVAKLLRDNGATVTGSDEGVYPPISDFLDQQSIPYTIGYNAKNIPLNCEAIVIGKNAKLVPKTNPEVRAANESGKPIYSFPEILDQLSAGKQTAVVAGSYGKSSCTSLLSHVLEQSGLDPSYFIGAIPLTPVNSSHSGQGDIFVLEGDEYPSSNTDPRAKFLHYHPKAVLLVPLAHDHVNVYPAVADYLKPFTQFAAMPEILVACVDGPLSKSFIGSLSRPLITYGLNEGDYHAANIRWGEVTHFDFVHQRKTIGSLAMSQLGEHSVQNIVGVGAFLLSQNIVSFGQFKAAVASFKGVRRRLDRLTDKSALPIFEGFGSSYEKARSAIAAVKKHFPDHRLIVVFEPHAFSWRNRDALAWYDDAFEGAAKVFVYEPAMQGATTHAQLTQDEIVKRIAASGTEAISLPATGGANVVEVELTNNDVVLLLTSGAMGGLISALSKRVNGHK